MLSNLDDSVGAILEKLRALKLENDTLIFFLSDNGGPTAELTSSNKPLRGGKGQLWEGGIREPFLVQWKGTVPSGKTFTNPVISLDIYATAMMIAGAKPPSSRTIDGVNLLPYFLGDKDSPPHEMLFWRYGQNLALRKGDWKVVQQSEHGNGKAALQLFNLADDPGETKNLAAENWEIFGDLKSRLEAINQEMVPPRWNSETRKKP
jgi:arylsulfatase B